MNSMMRLPQLTLMTPGCVYPADAPVVSGEGRFRGLLLSALFAISLLVIAAMPLNVAAQETVSPFGFGDTTDEEIVLARSVLSTTAVKPGDTAMAAVVVTILPSWHINSAAPYADFLIPAQVTLGEVDGLSAFGVTYPKGHDTRLGDELMSVYDAKAVIPFSVAVAGNLAPGEYKLPVTFTSQPCNDKTCLAPRDVDATLRITVGSGGVVANEEIFAAAVENHPGPASEAPISDEAESDLQRLIDEYGFWGYFLALGLAFVTGLLLSFSPCTYPMIPITVSIFAGQQRSIGKGFVMSLFYVGSMAIVYGIMGLIVSLVEAYSVPG